MSGNGSTTGILKRITKYLPMKILLVLQVAPTRYYAVVVGAAIGFSCARQAAATIRTSTVAAMSGSGVFLLQAATELLIKIMLGGKHPGVRSKHSSKEGIPYPKIGQGETPSSTLLVTA